MRQQVFNWKHLLLPVNISVLNMNHLVETPIDALNRWYTFCIGITLNSNFNPLIPILTGTFSLYSLVFANDQSINMFLNFRITLEKVIQRYESAERRDAYLKGKLAADVVLRSHQGNDIAGKRNTAKNCFLSAVWRERVVGGRERERDGGRNGGGSRQSG